MARKKSATLSVLCFYCKQGVVYKLPAKCPVCRRNLTTPITGKTPLPQLAELAIKNHVHLQFEAVPLNPKDQAIADRVNEAMKKNRKISKELRKLAGEARDRAMNMMLYGTPDPHQRFDFCLCGRVGMHCPTHGKTTT